MISNAVKNFDILTTNLNIPHNYFDNSILFPYLTKFLDISAKFPCNKF